MLCILGLATLWVLQRCGIGNAVHTGIGNAVELVMLCMMRLAMLWDWQRCEIGNAVHTTVLPCACHAAYTPV